MTRVISRNQLFDLVSALIKTCNPAFDDLSWSSHYNQDVVSGSGSDVYQQASSTVAPERKVTVTRKIRPRRKPRVAADEKTFAATESSSSTTATTATTDSESSSSETNQQTGKQGQYQEQQQQQQDGDSSAAAAEMDLRQWRYPTPATLEIRTATRTTMHDIWETMSVHVGDCVPCLYEIKWNRVWHLTLQRVRQAAALEACLGTTQTHGRVRVNVRVIMEK